MRGRCCWYCLTAATHCLRPMGASAAAADRARRYPALRGTCAEPEVGRSMTSAGRHDAALSRQHIQLLAQEPTALMFSGALTASLLGISLHSERPEVPGRPTPVPPGVPGQSRGSYHQTPEGLGGSWPTRERSQEALWGWGLAGAGDEGHDEVVSEVGYEELGNWGRRDCWRRDCGGQGGRLMGISQDR